ncbi:3-oxoacyl-[acyl-carrier-protein] synthase III, chloroplastic [Zea mays]|uniref:3-oxoacyl-[acyl-carrier-protein] synthase III, chloroplastic n=2 Tax=Zea mays TaxID=4577 RepID=A0A3L6GA11_MAIZE|nr:3-oxoacyl-[acyl-carrier-protein] synthase III, chloroplastic [Zea mays]
MRIPPLLASSQARESHAAPAPAPSASGHVRRCRSDGGGGITLPSMGAPPLHPTPTSPTARPHHHYYLLSIKQLNTLGAAAVLAFSTTVPLLEIAFAVLLPPTSSSSPGSPSRSARAARDPDPTAPPSSSLYAPSIRHLLLGPPPAPDMEGPRSPLPITADHGFLESVGGPPSMEGHALPHLVLGPAPGVLELSDAIERARQILDKIPGRATGAYSQSQVLSEVGCTKAFGFDITAACSGFLVGLITATRFIKDALSNYVDWTDRGTCILFGDAAGAVLVQACSADEDGMLGFCVQSDGNGQKHLSAIAANDESILSNTNGVPGFTPKKATYSCIQMNRKEVFRFAVRCVPQSIEKALPRSWFACLQYRLIVVTSSGCPN